MQINVSPAELVAFQPYELNLDVEMPDYPGLGLPLRHFEWDEGFKLYPIGAHHGCIGSDSQMLFVREVGMMIIINQLTDKFDWHKKVFDDTIVDKWRREAREYPDESLWAQAALMANDPRSSVPSLQGIMSDKAFDYCILELRNKAPYCERSGIIPTLDASFSVAKSDIVVNHSVRETLRQAFDRLSTG